MYASLDFTKLAKIGHDSFTVTEAVIFIAPKKQILIILIGRYKERKWR